MAKGRKKGNNKPKMAKKKSVGNTGPRKMLDGAATAYAKLLLDPCNAPVVHPIYPGGDAGYLFRAESFVTYAAAPGETSGYVHWTPGYNNASLTHLVYGAGNNPGVPLLAAAQTGAPGYPFLAANAKGVRCVAACMKVTYPGAEADRSGRVHYGLTTAGLIDAGNNYTVDSVAQALQHFSRTPSDTFEVVWKPSIADTEFNDPNESASPVIRDRKSSLTLAYAGLPQGAGITVHFTAVYEWTPANGIGIGHNALGKAQSVNTMDQVVDALIQGGFTFVRHAGAMAGQMLGSSLTAGIASTFGIMPAQGRSRRIAFH